MKITRDIKCNICRNSAAVSIRLPNSLWYLCDKCFMDALEGAIEMRATLLHCDVKNCPTPDIRVGIDESTGWENFTMGTTTYDFCPIHSGKLHAFIDNKVDNVSTKG